MPFSVALDLFPLTAAVLAALACGVLGNFLVLRKESLMGDAISHSVLPGLVIAFIVSSTRGPLVMLAGAAVAGLLTVVLVEVVKRLGRIEPGAAMGVVFSVLFALGVLLIETASLRHLDLDADCVLYGQLETLVWFGGPASISDALSWETIEAAPRQVVTLAVVLLISVLFVALFFKELRIASFDPALANSSGINATGVHYALMVLVALATVASFEAVGSILVIAMLVCPAATARLLTDRLASQVWVSVLAATVAAAGGYAASAWLPGVWGLDSVNAAGSIAAVSGLLLGLTIAASPSQGIAARLFRHRALARRVALDDLLAFLWRAAETGSPIVNERAIALRFRSRPYKTAVRLALRRGLVVRDGGLRLTREGSVSAAEVIRRHRQWERYLVDTAGLASDHVHPTAARLEHLDVVPRTETDVDPHGRRIPPMDASN